MHLLKVIVLTDSRGGRNSELEYFLDKMNDLFNVELKVMVIPGAGFEKICEIADQLAEDDPNSIFYIMCGICDITLKDMEHQIYFNVPSVEEKLEELKNLIDATVNYLRFRHDKTIFHLLPVTGAELNRFCHYTEGIAPQTTMNELIWYLNLHIDQLNKTYGSTTCWTSVVVHKYRNGVVNHRYFMLKDGLHPDLETIERWAHIIMNHLKSHFNRGNE